MCVKELHGGTGCLWGVGVSPTLPASAAMPLLYPSPAMIFSLGERLGEGMISVISLKVGAKGAAVGALAAPKG